MDWILTPEEQQKVEEERKADKQEILKFLRLQSASVTTDAISQAVAQQGVTDMRKRRALLELAVEDRLVVIDDHLLVSLTPAGRA